MWRIASAVDARSARTSIGYAYTYPLESASLEFASNMPIPSGFSMRISPSHSTTGMRASHPRLLNTPLREAAMRVAGWPLLEADPLRFTNETDIRQGWRSVIEWRAPTARRYARGAARYMLTRSSSALLFLSESRSSAMRRCMGVTSFQVVLRRGRGETVEQSFSAVAPV